jgi:PAS domain S-box-containing protein
MINEFLRSPRVRRLAWAVLGAGAVTAAAVGFLSWPGRALGTGPIRVGYRNQPPFYFAGTGHAPDGIAVQVIATAARRLGIAVEWTLIAGTSDAPLRAKRIDVWPTSPMEARSAEIRVTEPWLESTFFLVARAGRLPTGDDVSGRTVAAAATSLRGDVLGTRTLRGATQRHEPSPAAAFEAVCTGTVDAALIEGRQVQWLLLNRPPACNGVPIEFAPGRDAVRSYGIGSTPAAAGYAAALRTEISRMAEDGTLASIHARWSLGTVNETRLVYELQRAQQRGRLTLYGAVAIGVAFLLSLWQVRRSVQATRLAESASRAMEAYAQQQERYRLLFERNLAGVVQTTIGGTILDCNLAFAKMLGFESRQDLLATPDWQFYMDPADRAASLARLREEGAVSNCEIHARRKDGSSAWLLGSITMIEQGAGRPAILESTAIDITEQRRLEEQYRQAQKLESVGRLAGGVAHDFNNLLTAIIGYTELSLSEVSGDSPVRPSLEEIGKAAQRAASLTHQLLAFSRKQLLQPVVLNLNDVLAETQRLLRRLIGEDIDLVIDFEPRLAPVRADPSQLQQVVMNLAVNARDAMPDGGTLRLETRNVEVSATDALVDPDAIVGPCVRLTVSDTGQGMDADTRRRVFEPFFTTKERGKGTGLGLSTVYGIVKQSGGHIALRSVPGEGTTFEIFLPRVAGGADSLGATSGAGTTVLVVEMDPGIRGLAVEVLSSHGFQALPAAGADEALDIWRRGSESIRLLVVGPGLDGEVGRALADRLASERPSLRVLFVAAAAAPDGQRVHTGRRSVDALEQPFTPLQLVQKVVDLLGPAPAGRRE